MLKKTSIVLKKKDLVYLKYFSSEVIEDMIKRKWYTSLPFLLICFSFWFFVIPGILGVGFLVVRLMDDRNVYKEWKNQKFIKYLNNCSIKEELEKEIVDFKHRIKKLEIEENVKKERLSVATKVLDLTSSLESLNENIKQKKTELSLIGEIEELKIQLNFMNKEIEQKKEKLKLLNLTNGLEDRKIELSNKVLKLDEKLKKKENLKWACEVVEKRKKIISQSRVKSKIRKYRQVDKLTIDIVGLYYQQKNVEMVMEDAKVVGLLDGYEKVGSNGLVGFHGAPLIEMELVPVDNNSYDKNAVEARVCLSNRQFVHVGYVPRELCKSVRKLLCSKKHENLENKEERMIVIEPITTYLKTGTNSKGEIWYHDDGIRATLWVLENLGSKK